MVFQPDEGLENWDWRYKTMVTVKFFGLISVDNNIKQLDAKPGTVRDVLKEVKQNYPNVTEEQLVQAVMFINKENIDGNKRFSIILKDGDELALLSPSSGG